MSNQNQSSRLRRHYLQAMGENLDDSTQDASNQPSSRATASTDSKSLSRSETGKRQDVHDRLRTTASTGHHLMDMLTQSDIDDDEEKSDTVKQLDKMVLDVTWNLPLDQKQQQAETMTMNDPVLLPKINQLSTAAATTTTGTVDHHEPLVKEIQADLDKIPDYLTKHHPPFQQMIQHLHATIKATTTVTIIDHTNNKTRVRKIALLIYKIMILQTYHLLWTAYLKSGLGQLIVSSNEEEEEEEEEALYQTDIPIWPTDLKVFFVSKLTSRTKQNENELYLNFVHQQLDALHHHLHNYQHQLNVEVNQFHGYSLPIQKIIETYLEEHLRTFRMKIEYQTELVQYDYHIRALKLEFLRHHPNPFQQQLMNQACRRQYDQETSEQGYQLLRQQIHHRQTSPNHAFECSPLGRSTTRLLGSIPDTDRRQQIFQQYKNLVEQARDELFQVDIKFLDEARKELRMKYEEIIKTMWTAHRHPKDQIQTISSLMIQMITQRCEKISERIRCMYKFNAQSILL